ncbi:hypothetical protein K443DRAFT_685795 [Laccaria amethystina LaAM-08-1]|uniref:Uncharacterized protein n=1 Tax=Laccaria amethystina LaAM-08-1 TaxID=1095629 RepID=A0A0C9WN79_9AGAR|nr:hypothetical protein K443DRAFT_685795 [Laccaria amethystina LaAM-08-1]
MLWAIVYTLPFAKRKCSEREDRDLSLGLGGGCFDGKDTTRWSVVIVENGDFSERAWSLLLKW